MNALDWLLDADPALRWQAMRDLTDTPSDQVATERGEPSGRKLAMTAGFGRRRKASTAAGTGGFGMARSLDGA